MYSNEDAEQIKKHWFSQLMNYEKECRKAARRRNVAAFADFTKNLLSIVAQSRGLNGNVVGASSTGRANEEYKKAQERYRNAHIDYEGKVAALKLKSQPASVTVVKPLNPLLEHSRRQLPNPFSNGSATVSKPLGYSSAALHNGSLQRDKSQKQPYWYSNKTDKL